MTAFVNRLEKPKTKMENLTQTESNQEKDEEDKSLFVAQMLVNDKEENTVKPYSDL